MPSRSKTACILASGTWGADHCIFKQRDLSHIPEIQLVREMYAGIELAYLKDADGYIEGMNEFGVGASNSYLSEDDQQEMGLTFLKALHCPTAKEALQVVLASGILGHTIIGDPETVFTVERTKDKPPVVTQQLWDAFLVRTNHGIDIPGAGYSEGPHWESSLVRWETARSVLPKAKRPSEVPTAILRARSLDRLDPNSVVRNTTERMTTSQMLMNLSRRQLYLYLFPERVRFRGTIDRLPNHREPKIFVDILKYAPKNQGPNTIEVQEVPLPCGEGDRPDVCVPIPMAHQETDYTCGVASLQAILAFYGIVVPEPELAVALGTTEDSGSEPEQIASVAESFGLSAEIKRGMTISEVKGYLEKGIPVMINFVEYNEGHFSVAIAYDDSKGRLYLMDPYSNCGSYIPYSQVDSRWHGTTNPERDKHLGIIITRKTPMAQRTASDAHARSIALMKFLSQVAKRLGAAEHVYVVGGAVRNWLIQKPIKDIDVVVDSVKLGKDSAWFAAQVAKAIPVATSLVTNQYGVAILTVKGDWILDGISLQGEVIEIANARKESYGGTEGKGYKPHMVEPATIEEDIYRREFSFNALLWRLLDLTHGPERAEVIDLTGCGLKDLQEGNLRCPRDPDITFSDDPTRILRAVKFVARYGFKIPPDLAASIRRNAPKMKQAPWEAIGTLLVRDVLNTPSAKKCIKLMVELGIMDVIADMLRENKAFASYLRGELTGRQVDILLDLADLGLPVSSPISFLTPEQQRRLREITDIMDTDEAKAFLTLLKQPPIDNLALIARFPQIPATERGQFAATARRLMLETPTLAYAPGKLQAEVERQIGSHRMAFDRQKNLLTKLEQGPLDSRFMDPKDFNLLVKLVAKGLVEQRPGVRGIGTTFTITEKGKTMAKTAAIQRVADAWEHRVADTESNLRQRLFQKPLYENEITPAEKRILQVWARRGWVNISRRILDYYTVTPEGKDGIQADEYDSDQAGRDWYSDRIHTRSANAATGKVTGDGTEVGLFIRLPVELAEMYPPLSQDKSPSHVTLLYVGSVEKEREQDFLNAITSVIREEPGPIRAWLDGVDRFIQPGKDQTVFYTPVRFSKPLGTLKDTLAKALTMAGFTVQDSFPLSYNPHVTLEYREGTEHEAQYEGAVPDGAWEFNTIEVWGLPQLYQLEMGTFDRGPVEMVDLKRQSVDDLRAAWGPFLDR